MKKIIFLIFLTFSYVVHCDNPAPIVYQKQTTNVKEDFNITDANKDFDQINLKLSSQNLNLKDLTNAIKKLQKLNNFAQECIENTQKKINNLNNLLITPSTPETKDKPSLNQENSTADQVYLQTESKRLTNEQAQCRLFSIRASEAISVYQSTVAELKKEETFSQTLPIWHSIPKLINNIKTDRLFNQNPNIDISLVSWNYLAITLLLAFISAFYIFYYFSNVTKFKKIFRIKDEKLEWVISLFINNWMLINLIWFKIYLPDSGSIANLCQKLAIFASLIFLNHFIFSIKRVRALFYWYTLDFKYFDQLISVIIYILLLRSIGQWIKPLLEPTKTFSIVAQTIFLLLILVLNIKYVFRFVNQSLNFKWIRTYQKKLKGIAIVFSLTCLICDVLGYHVLAMRLLSAGMIIMFIIFCTSLLMLGIQKIYIMAVSAPQNNKIRYLFGYKENGNYTELLILKISLQLLTIAGSLYLIGQSMGFISYYVDLTYLPLINGITLGNFTLYPARIVFGFIIFCVLFLLCRILSTAISRYHQFENEEDTQVAVASILNYVGFTLALIAALLTAGFNFTGLAIVAGALSVGIGLGLQSIVNNFVSGLILLIEKPIKPGDRINVDGVEGTVKKIRVRSTQIITPQREDIIVPNSDLVTRRVTNYMYTDKYLSIISQITVAYDSDLKLINDLLLQAAYAHEDIIKTGRQKPHVLFKGFGDHTLVFQLWCLIRDANKKSMISSDLNYSIFKLFNENNINVPMPQQMIYMNDISEA